MSFGSPYKPMIKNAFTPFLMHVFRKEVKLWKTGVYAIWNMRLETGKGRISTLFSLLIKVSVLLIDLH